VHIMGKMSSVSEYMLRQKRERNLYTYPGLVRNDGAPTSATDITQNNLFRQLVRTIFEKFTQTCSDSVRRVWSFIVFSRLHSYFLHWEVYLISDAYFAAFALRVVPFS